MTDKTQPTAKAIPAEQTATLKAMHRHRGEWKEAGGNHPGSPQDHRSPEGKGHRFLIRYPVVV